MKTITIRYYNIEHTFVPSSDGSDDTYLKTSDYCYRLYDEEDIIEDFVRANKADIDGRFFWSELGEGFYFCNENISDRLDKVADWGYAERESGTECIYDR